MKHTVIKQSDIKEEDGFIPYDDLKIRLNESDIEMQQGRDVVSISKRKLSAVIEWLYNNGCEMAFVNTDKQVLKDFFNAGYDFRSSMQPDIKSEFGENSCPNFEQYYKERISE